MYGQRMGFGDWFCGAGGLMPGPFGMILTILLWIALIVLAWKVIHYLFSVIRKDNSSSSMKLLKQRYAAGELTKTEFEEMKQDLARN